MTTAMCDVSVIHPIQGFKKAPMEAGTAAKIRASDKIGKYKHAIDTNTERFYALVIETFGHMHDHVYSLITSLSHRVDGAAPARANWTQSSFTQYWLQQLSCTLWRENATIVQQTVEFVRQMYAMNPSRETTISQYVRTTGPFVLETFQPSADMLATTAAAAYDDDGIDGEHESGSNYGDEGYLDAFPPLSHTNDPPSTSPSTTTRNTTSLQSGLGALSLSATLTTTSAPVASTRSPFFACAPPAAVPQRAMPLVLGPRYSQQRRSRNAAPLPPTPLSRMVMEMNASARSGEPLPTSSPLMALRPQSVSAFKAAAPSCTSGAPSANATATLCESASAQSASVQFSQPLLISNQKELTDLSSQSVSIAVSQDASLTVDSEYRLVEVESVDIVADSV
jgi:hypothetical protein